MKDEPDEVQGDDVAFRAAIVGRGFRLEHQVRLLRDLIHLQRELRELVGLAAGLPWAREGSAWTIAGSLRVEAGIPCVDLHNLSAALGEACAEFLVTMNLESVAIRLIVGKGSHSRNTPTLRPRVAAALLELSESGRFRVMEYAEAGHVDVHWLTRKAQATSFEPMRLGHLLGVLFWHGIAIKRSVVRMGDAYRVSMRRVAAPSGRGARAAFTEFAGRDRCGFTPWAVDLESPVKSQLDEASYTALVAAFDAVVAPPWGGSIR